MLFDISLFRAPLPNGVRVFASGAIQLAEINGFSRLGIQSVITAPYCRRLIKSCYGLNADEIAFMRAVCAPVQN